MHVLHFSAQVEHMHDPRSEYAEAHWLPVVGPTAYLLARRCAHVAQHARILHVDLADLGSALGVKPAKVLPALRRLAHFGLAVELNDHHWMVDVLWPQARTPRSIQAA